MPDSPVDRSWCTAAQMPSVQLQSSVGSPPHTTRACGWTPWKPERMKTAGAREAVCAVEAPW
jgi:hypothetical protein